MFLKGLFIQYLITIIAFVIPPFFNSNEFSIERLISFSPFIIFQILISLLYFFQYIKIKKQNLLEKNILLKQKVAEVSETNLTETNKTVRIINFLKYTSITLGLLLLTHCAFQFLQMLFLSSQSSNSANLNGNLKEKINFIHWAIIFVNLLVSAFYEEVIYRMFLPEYLHLFCKKIKSCKAKKIVAFICEFLVILCFAFSHFYLGIIPVLNAFICGLILRICFIKSEGITSGFCAHFIYNLLLTIFTIVLAC